MAPTAPLVSRVCADCGAPVTFELGALQIRCAHCDSGMAIDQGLRLVSLRCPRCCGNFYYVDGSLCGRCPYCDAPVLAVSRDRLLRYVIRPQTGAPAGADGAVLRLLPFWHLSGMSYGWDVGAHLEVVEDQSRFQQDPGSSTEGPVPVTRTESMPTKLFRGRVLDLSVPDPATSALGIAGLRTRGSVFPLEPFTAEAESLGQVVPASLELARARELLWARALGTARALDGISRLDCRRVDLVSESLSLFYYPFWVQAAEAECPRVWDAVSGEPERLVQRGPAPVYGSSAAFDELRLVELACGGCGQALAPANHPTVLPCTACGSFWEVCRQGLKPFSATFARPPRSAARALWLPFWRLETTLSYGGREATRASDLRQVLGLLQPAGTTPPEPAAPLHTFVAAYGARRAPKMDFAARDLTRAQPALQAGPRTEGEIYTCFLGAEDARALGYSTWIPLLGGTVAWLVRSLRVRIGQVSLWYVPFEDCGRELVCLLTGLRYDRVAFRGVGH